MTITFAYDKLNRLTQKSYTIPPSSGITNPGTVTYTYDDPAQSFSKGRFTREKRYGVPRGQVPPRPEPGAG